MSAVCIQCIAVFLLILVKVSEFNDVVVHEVGIVVCIVHGPTLFKNYTSAS